jgi:hypothetical protein
MTKIMYVLLTLIIAVTLFAMLVISGNDNDVIVCYDAHAHNTYVANVCNEKDMK